jgi:hypothetical protein
MFPVHQQDEAAHLVVIDLAAEIGIETDVPGTTIPKSESDPVPETEVVAEIGAEIGTETVIVIGEIGTADATGVGVGIMIGIGTDAVMIGIGTVTGIGIGIVIARGSEVGVGTAGGIHDVLRKLYEICTPR